MSGYFSQLAHHTGLSLDPAAAKRPDSGSAVRPVGIGVPAVAPVESLHVEDISFTSEPARDAAEGENGHIRALSEGDRDAAVTNEIDIHDRRESTEAVPMHAAAAEQPSRDVSTAWPREEPRIPSNSSGRASRLGEDLAAEGFSVSEAPATRLDQSGVGRRVLTQESIGVPFDSIEIVESQFAQPYPEARGPQAARGAPPRVDETAALAPGAPSDSVDDEPAQRETIVRNYLKEVRAWVSAPPELDQRQPEGRRDAERLPALAVAEQFLANRGDAFPLDREVRRPTHLPTVSETLDVQDLNLSIGTVSIVIEEPKQIAPAGLQPPPRVDGPRERPASEPTRLSRYYLGRW